MVAKFANGFAISEGNGNMIANGRFYVLLGNDIYRVVTIAIDPDDYDTAMYVATISKNGFKRVNDDPEIKSICDQINQFFCNDEVRHMKTKHSN